MHDNNKTSARTGKVFNAISALLAFILWGGWAYFINGGHSFRRGLVSGLAQGIASGLITLFMIRAVSCCLNRLGTESLPQSLLPAVLTVSFTGSCLACLHYLIGTPHILFTIAPALSTAFAFCLFTTFKLKQKT
jgi:hypothetical protein